MGRALALIVTAAAAAIVFGAIALALAFAQLVREFGPRKIRHPPKHLP